MTNHTIYMADSRIMPEVSDESVHLVITSPPYWQLKDYEDVNQIGFYDTYEDYINNLNLVWNECRRVLKKGCRLCINIGDQFARSVYYGRYKVIPIRTEIIKFCESAGFDYMGAIIWQKVTTCNTTGGATIMGSFPYPRNGILKIDYEFILLFKKPGTPPSVEEEIKKQAKLSTKEWNEYFSGHWVFPGEKQNKHIAMFPEELPKRLIKMFCFPKETVLDPFLGSGTTSLAAKNLNRHSIGYEINESYLPGIKNKLGVDQTEIFRKYSIDIIIPERDLFDFKQEIKKLPYVFRDMVKFEKKKNAGDNTFGSKIKAKQKEKFKYLRLKRVITPNILELNNEQIVKLIGITLKAGVETEAIKWLEDKLKGQSVFLKSDQNEYDESNNLLSYVYLKNKTFINLHLLRSNLVEIDESVPFKYLKKFKAVSEEINQIDATEKA